MNMQITKQTNKHHCIVNVHTTDFRMNGEPSELRYLEKTKSLTSSLKKVIIIAEMLQIIRTVNMDLIQAVQTVRKNRIEERVGLSFIFLNILVMSDSRMSHSCDSVPLR